MNINKLFNEINNRRAGHGKDAITRDEFLEVISAMGVRGEIINNNGEIYPIKPIQVELARSRFNHMKNMMNNPELS